MYGPVPTWFVDALSYALDPTGSGQVYPEYYFAMVATFGPFNVLLSKLLHTIFYRPSSAIDTPTATTSSTATSTATTTTNQRSGKSMDDETSYFHGYASRKHCVEVLREHCGGDDLIPGAFVLRFSTNRPGQLSISWVNAKTEIKHTALLNRRENGYVCDKVGGSGSGMGYQKIGDLLEHHDNFFMTPCRVSRQTSWKKYDNIKSQVMEEWKVSSAETITGDSPYAEANGSDVYGACRVKSCT